MKIGKGPFEENSTGAFYLELELIFINKKVHLLQFLGSEWCLVQEQGLRQVQMIL